MQLPVQQIANPSAESLVAQAESLLGPVLTSYILDHSPSRAANRPAASTTPIELGLIPLAQAVEIATMLNTLEDLSTIQAWFAGRNPMLDDNAPAAVIVTDATAVQRAARRFLAQG